MTSFRAEAGRLDQEVARAAGLTRVAAQRAIAEGRVLVDGRARTRSHRLQGGEAVEVDLSAGPAVSAEGPAVPVRYQDEHLLVVAKPAGLVAHPTERRRTGTLVNRLLGMGVRLSSVGGPLRAGIVHRLDGGTSGLMVVAKTDRAHELLAAMLARREVRRRYLALVRGEVAHTRFAVDAPLGRRGARVAVRRGTGRQAETAFEVRERLERATLLEAVPRTGRTHQIRVHLSSVGHPILGDRAYGGGGDDATSLGLERPFLHAARLSFTHPVTGEELDLLEPLPPDLVRALDRARRPA